MNTLQVTRRQRVRWAADCHVCRQPIAPRTLAVRLRDRDGRPSWAHASCLPLSMAGDRVCATHLARMDRREEWNRTYTRKDIVGWDCPRCQAGGA